MNNYFVREFYHPLPGAYAEVNIDVIGTEPLPTVEGWLASPNPVIAAYSGRTAITGSKTRHTVRTGSAIDAVKALEDFRAKYDEVAPEVVGAEQLLVQRAQADFDLAISGAEVGAPVLDPIA